MSWTRLFSILGAMGAMVWLIGDSPSPAPMSGLAMASFIGLTFLLAVFLFARGTR